MTEEMMMLSAFAEGETETFREDFMDMLAFIDKLRDFSAAEEPGEYRSCMEYGQLRKDCPREAEKANASGEYFKIPRMM